MKIDDYIVDGNVARNRVALSIKYRKISRDDIERLISDKRVSSGFLGESFTEKVPKEQWNESYLDKLSYASIAESFNPDYLFYLDEVAKYVTKSQNRKKVIRRICVILILLAIASFLFIACNKISNKTAINTRRAGDYQIRQASGIQEYREQCMRGDVRGILKITAKSCF